MNRTELVKSVSLVTSVPPEQVDRVMSAMLDVIGMSLSCGERVSIRNFGKFEPRLRSAMERKNPKNGNIYSVPEKVSVGFLASPSLKNRLNQ